MDINKGKLGAVLRGMRSLAGRDILVGYPSDDDQPHEGQAPVGAEQRNEGGITNAALGYIHEHGAPEAGIPARPHLLPGVRDAKEKVTSYFKQAGQAALAGDESKVDRAMHAAGLAAQSSVRNKIRAGDFVPLKQSTIRRRMTRGTSKRKGIKVDPKSGMLVGAQPLIDSAQMLRAVAYIVRNNKS